jgi:metacaspase-1
MVNRALCVGINDYPIRGMDLKGCVNDAKAWASALVGHFDFASGDVSLLLDADATKRNVVARLKRLLENAQRGDVLVFTNSSHGTYLADTDGDEPRFDEAMCPWDCDERLIVDDELRALFDDLPVGVRGTVVSDSCHSGSVMRALPPEFGRTPDKRRVRFLNPRRLGLPELASDVLTQARSTRLEWRPESVMKEVLVSGCRDVQYSYDAKIGNRYHGAMTYYALQSLEAAKWNTEYRRWVPRINALLRRGGYTDQNPQLEGRTAAKSRRVFR